MLRAFLLSIIIGLSIHTSIAQESEGMGVEAPRQQKGEEGKAGSGEPYTEPFSVPIRIVEEPDEAKRTRDREEAGDQREKNDLEAQQRAADAAIESAASSQRQENLAKWQLGLSIAGIIALVVTIAYSIKATNAAIKSADLAEKAVAITQDTAKRELRAYVAVSRVKFTDMHTGVDAKIEVSIINAGATPARKVRSRVWTTIGSGESQGRIFSSGGSDGLESVADLAQGSAFHTRETVYGGPLSPSEHGYVLSGSKQLYVVGIVTYQDVFRVTRRTLFKSVLDVDSIDEKGNGKAIPCRTGNRSS